MEADRADDNICGGNGCGDADREAGQISVYEKGCIELPESGL